MKPIQAIKNNLLMLVVTALGVLGAWGFWVYSQQSAFDFIYIYLVITLLIENWRLRSRLRKRDAEDRT